MSTDFGDSDLQRDPNPQRADLPLTLPPGGVPTEQQAAHAMRLKAGRNTVHSVHYDLSLVVQNPERGPSGAVVLLHDLPGGAFVWSDVLPALATTGRAVYAFDMLGYGQSEHPWPSDTSLWGHADVLTAAFQRLGLRDVVLVGYGVGGGVAQILAARLYRAGVAKLVLIDSYAYSYAFAPDWPVPDMTAHQDPEAAHHSTVEKIIGELRATLPKASAQKGALNPQRLDAYVDEWNSETGKHMLYQHIRLLVPSYQNSPSADLREFDKPVLLVWGSLDKVTPISLGERLQREIPGARFERIPKAGHLVLDDAPQAVASLLADFAGPRG